jgi:hypothetical protein
MILHSKPDRDGALVAKQARQGWAWLKDAGTAGGTLQSTVGSKHMRCLPLQPTSA